MKFILKNWVIYYTKEVAKTLKLITIGLAMVLTVVCVKYKPVYKVTISGETIGYVENRKLIEAKIDKYINNTSGNIGFREIDALPEYEFKFVNREKETGDDIIMAAIEDLTTTTYRFYAVLADGERKAIVENIEEAEYIIDEIKSDLSDEINLELGILEVYMPEYEIVSEEEAINTLNEVKTAKVVEYEENKKKAALAKAKTVAQKRSFATTATSAPSGNLNGLALSIPVNGSISSRFGARSSIRSSAHTGLDIASSSGTGIRAIAPGTVVYVGYKGSYGKLIIVDHGNGVQSYYAHCSALYVTQGQSVDSSTTIGAVGSTGNSTGPHLHLEIRINGTPVNPQNYLYN